MHSQSQIKRTLSTPLAVAYVAGLLDSGEFIHRSELAEFVCEQCGFHDARGHAQLDGCLKALRELEASGHFALPAAQAKTGPNTAEPAHRRLYRGSGRVEATGSGGAAGAQGASSARSYAGSEQAHASIAYGPEEWRWR